MMPLKTKRIGLFLAVGGLAVLAATANAQPPMPPSGPPPAQGQMYQQTFRVAPYGAYPEGSTAKATSYGTINAGKLYQTDPNNTHFQLTQPPDNYGGGWGYGGGYGGAYRGAGGYLNGVSNVMNASGNLQIQSQQAQLVGQDVQRSKMDTRRMAIDEYYYEKERAPKLEDERAKWMATASKRARNSPPLPEIWAGTSLNSILRDLQRAMDAGLYGPNVPLDPSMLHQINVTAGTSNGSMGQLKDVGNMKWPLALQGDVFEEQRSRIDRLLKRALDQANGKGSVDADVILGLRQSQDKLMSSVKSQVATMNPGDYITAVQFLNDMKASTQFLQDPNIGQFASGRWSAQGRNVAELVGNMTQGGLRFAAATSGAEPAYTSLYNSMLRFDTGLMQVAGNYQQAQPQHGAPMGMPQ